MRSGFRIVLVAVAAGLAGIVAGIAYKPDSIAPIARTELGQRLLQGVLASTAAPAPPGVPIATRGQLVPAVDLGGLDGELIAVPRHFRGRPLLVNVWATWCGPCIKEMPELQRFASEQAGNGVQVVGIALDDLDSVRAFLVHTPVTYPILLDTPGPADVSVQLGNPKGVLPYSVLLDAEGRLLKQRIGPFADGEIRAWVQ